MSNGVFKTSDSTRIRRYLVLPLVLVVATHAFDVPSAAAKPRFRAISPATRLNAPPLSGEDDEASFGAIFQDDPERFGAVWVGPRYDDTAETVIRGRWFSAADMTPLADEFMVNTTPHAVDYGDTQPSVAATLDGQVLVAWTTQGPVHSDEDADDVFARTIEYPANLVGGEYLVNTTRRSDQNNVSVALTSNGDAVIAWKNTDFDVADETVRFQRYRSGVPFGEESIIRNTAVTSNGRVLATRANQIYLTWNGRERSEQLRSIYVAPLSFETSEIVAEPQVVSEEFENAIFPVIAELEDKALLIAWRREMDAANSPGIYSRKLGSDLTPDGPGTLVWLDPDPGEKRRHYFQVSSSPDGSSALAVWEIGNPLAYTRKIAIQLLDERGQPHGDLAIASSTLDAFDHQDPNVLFLDETTAVATWTATFVGADQTVRQELVGRLFRIGSLAPLCGDADDDGFVLATDALATLLTVVGAHDCSPCLCDVDSTGTVTAVDALAVLRLAVGIATPVMCVPCQQG